MSVFSELHEYDGLGLAELVRSRQVTAAELMDEAAGGKLTYFLKRHAPSVVDTSVRRTIRRSQAETGQTGVT